MSEQPPHPKFDPDDDALLAELRALAGEEDPVPEHVVAAARGSFTWRTIDAELAELAYDSALDTEQLAAVRSADAGRLLTFETPALMIELEVTAVGSRRSIRGQLEPPGPGAVEIRHAGGVLEVEADSLGRFTADGVEAGPVSLRCRRVEANTITVETEWVTM
jgi:hypothetical protein